MGTGVETYLIAVKALTLLCGGTVTILALRAYRRIGSPAMRALAVGLGLITVGSLVAGFLHQLLNTDLITGVAIESTFTALGFATLGYSLFATGNGSTAGD
jgi:O-antigen/teichoic acid export membrane protein